MPTAPIATTTIASPMTRPEGLNPGLAIGCQATPFQKYLPSWETQAAPSNRGGCPSLGGLIGHLVESGSKVDGLLRHAHLDGLATADVRATIDPTHDHELDRPLREALEDFARVRRRTVDLLHGWGKTEWERTVVDPRGGAFSLLEVCRLVTRHEMAHISQIRNLTV